MLEIPARCKKCGSKACICQAGYHPKGWFTAHCTGCFHVLGDADNLIYVETKQEAIKLWNEMNERPVGEHY